MSEREGFKLDKIIDWYDIAKGVGAMVLHGLSTSLQQIRYEPRQVSDHFRGAANQLDEALYDNVVELPVGGSDEVA